VFDSHKKKIQIGWSPYLSDVRDSTWLDLITDKPEKVLPWKITDGSINHCPAYKNFYENVFAIKMPFTLAISKDETNNKLDVVSTPNLTIEPLRRMVSFEKDDSGWNCQVCLSNLFISDTPDVTIEVLPPILHGLREEIIYLNGRFDIYSWQRPLQFSFRIPNKTFENMSCSNGIVFQKDDVVFYVRINIPNGAKVELCQFDDEDLKKVSDYVKRNTLVTSHVKGFDFKEILNRVFRRRPKRFLTNKDYGNV
jgi:hypothetical protein